MAKVTGPLLSFGASGTIGSTITFVASRGQNIARGLVIPANPQTMGQSMARIVLVATGAMLTRMNLNQVGQADGVIQTPKEYYTALRVAPQTWNSEFTRRGYPNGRSTWEADVAAYALLTEAEMLAWGVWNGAFSLPFDTITPPPGGAVAVVGDTVAYSWARCLARGGYLGTLPNLVPPVWDNTLRAFTKAELLRNKTQRGYLVRKLKQEQQARDVAHNIEVNKQFKGADKSA